jgi:hypothetical protein
MAASASIKYRAFLSYSHRDTGAAKRLHGRLDGFRIDQDLVGRETPMGPIPKQLRPIFRNRHDFDAGGTLADQMVAALHNSVALILIASSAAVKSNPVNEEVRLFASRHPDRPLIPLPLRAIPGTLIGNASRRRCLRGLGMATVYWPPICVIAATDASWHLPRLSAG